MQRTRASSGSGLWSEMVVSVCEMVARWLLDGYEMAMRRL